MFNPVSYPLCLDMGLREANIWRMLEKILMRTYTNHVCMNPIVFKLMHTVKLWKWSWRPNLQERTMFWSDLKADVYFKHGSHLLHDHCFPPSKLTFLDLHRAHHLIINTLWARNWRVHLRSLGEQSCARDSKSNLELFLLPKNHTRSRH